MRSANSINIYFEKTDELMVTEHDHIKGLSLHTYPDETNHRSVSIQLLSDHMTTLLKAVSILMKYATDAQNDAAIDSMEAIIRGYYDQQYQKQHALATENSPELIDAH